MSAAITIKNLDIDWDDLEIAYRDSATGIESFLDLHDGEVVAIFDPKEPMKGFVARHPERYVSIPFFRRADAIVVLRSFAQKMPLGSLRERLLDALPHPGALRRCNDLLECSAKLKQQYEQFEERAIFERLLLWLTAIGVCARSAPSFIVDAACLQTSDIAA